MRKTSVAIILPALNEEQTIGKVIDEIAMVPLEREGYEVQIVLVDGESSDRTRQIAHEKNARIIVEPRRGKGRAIRTAFQQVKADYIFMLDADYTYPATYIPDLLAKLRDGYDVVIGTRLTGKRAKGSISILNIIGNYCLTMLATILYRRRISDVCTGYWGFKGEIVPKLKLRADDFNLEADLFSQIAKNGYALGEIPIYYRRRSSRSKLKSIRAGIKIARTLIGRRF
ncbi:glycosyltransferase family 2 protein [Chloroflexota bacterium]